MARSTIPGMSLRQSEHGSPDYVATHDVVAVSPGGRELWVTESYYARNTFDPREKFERDYNNFEGTKTIDGQEVARFELREL